MDMDWSFASTPARISREEQREHAFPHFDGAEAPAPPRVFTHQVGCGSCCCAFKQPPFAMNDPAASWTVSVHGTRDVHKPQLTIVYAGSVSVFDNVSAETAQELMMLLASRGSLPNLAPDARKPEEAPIFAPRKVTVPAKRMPFQKPQHASPPLSKPISGVLQAASLPRSASSSSNVDSTLPTVPPISQAPPTQPATRTAAAKAAPQARKASLARFLEKRKERVTPGHKVARRFYVVETKMAPRSAATDPVSGDYGATTAAPCPSAKSPLESSGTIGSANEKSPCTVDIALSSNREESLCLGQPRNISLGQEHPSTKLQI